VLVWSVAIAYDRSKPGPGAGFLGRFWDVNKYPGKRPAQARGVQLEFA
jgi:putative spermidine/putrescine transport system substrate-binding protein